jgi:hypothetical protein
VIENLGRARIRIAHRLLSPYPPQIAMKRIKLTGREQAVLRSIDYANGSTGEEIFERTQIEPGDLADVLHALCDVGYVECFPNLPHITFLNYAATRFEVNPSYALELKEAMRRT